MGRGDVEREEVKGGGWKGKGRSGEEGEERRGC